VVAFNVSRSRIEVGLSVGENSCHQRKTHGKAQVKNGVESVSQCRVWDMPKVENKPERGKQTLSSDFAPKGKPVTPGATAGVVEDDALTVTGGGRGTENARDAATEASSGRGN
jgi:hypothetical protein